MSAPTTTQETLALDMQAAVHSLGFPSVDAALAWINTHHPSDLLTTSDLRQAARIEAMEGRYAAAGVLYQRAVEACPACHDRDDLAVMRDLATSYSRMVAP